MDLLLLACNLGQVSYFLQTCSEQAYWSMCHDAFHIREMKGEHIFVGYTICWSLSPPLNHKNFFFCGTEV
jgi:hypothetical protein